MTQPDPPSDVIPPDPPENAAPAADLPPPDPPPADADPPLVDTVPATDEEAEEAEEPTWDEAFDTLSQKFVSDRVLRVSAEEEAVAAEQRVAMAAEALKAEERVRDDALGRAQSIRTERKQIARSLIAALQEFIGE